MSLVLGVDTSTIVCAGLARDGRIIRSEAVGDTRSHAELLGDLVATMLAEEGVGPHDLTGVAIGVGPGPFTGLRVGIATGQTWAWVRGITSRGACSLDVLAGQWHASGTAPADGFVVASDARRKELYWATYDADGHRVDEPHVSAPTELPDLPVGGPGATAYPDVLGDRMRSDGPTHVDAGFLAAHVDDLPDVGLEPLYLRKPDAELPKTRKSTLTNARLSLPRRPR